MNTKQTAIAYCNVSNQHMLQFVATALKVIQDDRVGQEVNLYTHYNEISICTLLAPEEGGYQGMVEAKEKGPHKWDISVHQNVKKILELALIGLHT